MSSYGVSETGFKRKRLDLLLSELDTEMKSVFGDNFDTSSESVGGQIDGVISESQSNLWQIGEDAYNAFNPNAAYGVGLSNLVQLNGIVRKAATNSNVTLTITGTNATIIPINSLVSTSDTGTQFTTDKEVTIPIGGSITVDATAVDTGLLKALATTIDTIDTPITGWATVSNALDANVGQDEETDVELRARRELSVSKTAMSVLDTILAEILEVKNVTKAILHENDTGNVDLETLTPARSFQAVVLGGVDGDIAAAIFSEKPTGVPTFGNSSSVVVDSQGFNHTINFTRPSEKDIYIVVNLTTSASYSANGDDLIKQAIIDYANGVLVVGREFSIDSDVIHSEIYTPINMVTGHTVDSLYIGFAATPNASDDLDIDFDEISNFTLANITVNS